MHRRPPCPRAPGSGSSPGLASRGRNLAWRARFQEAADYRRRHGWRAPGAGVDGKTPMRGCVPGRFRGGPVYSTLRSSARSGDNPGPVSMARGINKVILVGNLGNDPETKYTQGGMAITTLSLATTSVRKDKDGNPQEKTEWHRVKLFGKVG